MEFAEQPDIDEAVQTIAQSLISSKHAVVYIGAGCSASAGVPTFRGKGAGSLLSVREDLADCHAPNFSHMLVAELVNRQMVAHVVTSNHDNLCRKSGVPEAHLSEMFGNAYMEVCLASGCNATFQRSTVTPTLNRRCDACGGKLKKKGCRYGQKIPQQPFNTGWEHAKESDFALVLGSGMHTYPLSGDGMPSFADKIAVVTLGASTRSRCPEGSLFVNASCDRVMERVAEELHISVPFYQFTQPFCCGYRWEVPGEQICVYVKGTTAQESVTWTVEGELSCGALQRSMQRNELTWLFVENGVRCRTGQELTVTLFPRDAYHGAQPMAISFSIGDTPQSQNNVFEHIFART